VLINEIAWIQSYKYRHNLEEVKMNLIQINFLVCSNFVKLVTRLMLALTNNIFVLMRLANRT
jgi:hypothetical protein